jgi:hypothetical protein
MKSLFIAIFALFSLTVFAQQNRQGKHRGKDRIEQTEMNPEQQASLRSKKMTLALDLSDAQEKKVYQLELAKAKERMTRREASQNGKDRDQADKFKRQEERLERQITFKRSLKEVLTDEQMIKWEKMQHHRRGRQRGEGRSERKKGRH